MADPPTDAIPASYVQDRDPAISQPGYRSTPRRFQVVNAMTGDVISKGRIHGGMGREGPWGPNSYHSLESLLYVVASDLLWPPTHVRLIVGDVVVSDTKPHETLLSDLDPTSPLLTIQAVKLPRPEYFDPTGQEGIDDGDLAPCGLIASAVLVRLWWVLLPL